MGRIAAIERSNWPGGPGQHVREAADRGAGAPARWSRVERHPASRQSGRSTRANRTATSRPSTGCMSFARASLDASCRLDQYGPPRSAARGRQAARSERRRTPRQDPRHDGEPDGYRLPQRRVLHRPPVHRPPPTEERDPGIEFAGEVEAVGAAVTEFKVGDRVFGISSWERTRVHRVRESGVVAHMPIGMSFEEAAAVADGALTSAVRLREGRPSSGPEHPRLRRLGSIGTAAVQLARHPSTPTSRRCAERERRARAIARRRRGHRLPAGGLHEERRDVRRRLRRGRQAVVRRCRRSLNPGGVFSTPTRLHVARPLVRCWTRWVGDKKATLLMPVHQGVPALPQELIEAGKYRAVIDRRYPLEDVVEATRYVETGQKTGNVVVAVSGERET